MKNNKFSAEQLFQSPSADTMHNFLRGHDPIWEKLPIRWEEAPFIGNGLTGAMFYVDPEQKRLKWLIGRSDVGRLDYPATCRDPNRIQIGALDQRLPPGTNILGGAVRLDLWNAEIRGSVVTDKGKLHFNAFAPSGSASFIVTTTISNAALRPEWGCEIRPEGRIAVSGDRSVFVADDFVPHPRTSTASGGFAVVWGERDCSENCRLFTCSVGSSPVNRQFWNAGDTGISARESAEKDYDLYTNQDIEEVKKKHQKWWHDFYQNSFFSFSHRELESLYWIQLYKFASTTRPDRPMIDNHGIWSTEAPYGFSTWDFNVQATYRLHLTGNFSEFGKPFLKFMNQSFNEKTMWRPEHGEYRAGMRQQNFLRYRFFDTQFWEHSKELPCDGPAKFLWGMHNYVMHYRHSLDDTMIPRISTMLEAGINAMLAGMEEEPDGFLHIPSGCSWECWTGKDPTGLLAVLNWALAAAIEFGEAAGVKPAKIAKWESIRNKIVPYPEDDEGYLLGQGQSPLPHRHWTHLMMLYPLDIIDYKNHEELKALRKSLDWWAWISAGLDGSKPQAGFSCPAAIALYAYLAAETDSEVDRGVIARLADIFLYQEAERGPCVWPATMYREVGPVMETPLFMASALQECFLQSRNDGVHVFPAAPEKWPDAIFVNWHTEGDFCISASRQKGKTEWIAVKGTDAGVLSLHTDMDTSKLFWNGEKKCPANVRIIDASTVQIAPTDGGACIISRTKNPDLSVRAVERRLGFKNSFGISPRFLANRNYKGKQP